MVSNAISAFGTLIQRGDGAVSEAFTTISELESISFDFKADNVDVSNMSSPNNWKEYLPTMKDGGEFSCSIAYVPNDPTHAALLLDFKNRTKRNFKLVFPDALNTWPFSAYVTSFSFNAKHDDALRASITLKVTGEPTVS